MLRVRNKRVVSWTVYAALSVLFVGYIFVPILFPIWLNAKLNAFEPSKDNVGYIMIASCILLLFEMFFTVSRAEKCVKDGHY